ncbi:transposase DDE domain protein [mine drainage metagenome]|uniref:Transposase DDE domain protein n=1 Tax=mine drainage metagenome TaxID=410659 RepID=A0A1J5Q7D4_9ZZZZ
MGMGLEARFERYCDVMVATMQHADREQPGRWYLKGLVLPGGRKSVEPMAARVQPQRVRSAHQSMHHLVAEAHWSDEALLAAVAGEVLPKLVRDDEPVWWVVDDTGFPKKGKHSVGVARQYCGQTGKQDNCRVAVTLTLATHEGSLPLAFRLYLPREWADDGARCESAGVPEEVSFATKPELAWRQIEAALQAGYPRGTVLADAAYGDETAWREKLAGRGLTYAVGVRPATTVWWGEHQPAAESDPAGGVGRPRRGLQRDGTHRPISVADLARALPATAWRTVTWRQGVSEPLRSRFARVRVRAAHRDRARAQEWLIIEWARDTDEPAHYWFSNLPQDMPWQQMVDTVMGRWRIERDYQELKQELGLGHFEGRNWRGFHHHASLCVAAYGFLMLERLSGAKKNAARFKTPALPTGFRPRGAGTDAAPRALVDRDVPLQAGARRRQNLDPVPMLRPQSLRTTSLVTQ